MLKNLIKATSIIFIFASLIFGAPFGEKSDKAFGKKIWEKMQEQGYNTIPAKLYVGGPPHGKVREVLEGKIDGKLIIVKRNYGGKGISIKKVEQNRAKYLKAITVMIKKDGYDKDNANWFWVKYKPDGTFFKNKKNMSLVGAVAKGKPAGCISCHASASGNDLVFTHNNMVNEEATLVGELKKSTMLSH